MSSVRDLKTIQSVHNSLPEISSESCNVLNNGRNGFDTTVLTSSPLDKASGNLETAVRSKLKNHRLFLISKRSRTNTDLVISTRRKNGPNQARNRKHVCYGNEYCLNGKRYSVNAKGSGLYSEILKSLLTQFEITVDKWKRVFVYRFDLHIHSYTSDNKLVSKFRKRLFERLKRRYGFKEIGFCWVREKERSKSQHYHWVLFLDGNLIKHPKVLIQIIREAWEMPTGNFHVPVVQNPFYFVENEETEKEAIYRISYLAKARGKGYRDKQAKDYQCSRMKPNPNSRLGAQNG